MLSVSACGRSGASRSPTAKEGPEGARYDSGVRSLKWIQAGWLEATVGLVLAIISLASAHRFPWPSTAMDLLAVAAILVSLRWLRIGVGMAILVAVLVPFVDPEFSGLSLYLCMIPCITAIRRDEFPLAVVITIAGVAVGVWASLRPFEPEVVTGGLGIVLVSWLGLAAIVWGGGLAIRYASRAAADRVESRFHAQQTALAAELHGSVSRDLSRLARQADAVRESGVADPEALQEIADRARSAEQALRQATWALAEGLKSSSASEMNPSQALAHGVRELKRAGFSVEAIEQGHGELRSDVAAVAARIIAEALHNVRSHGGTEAPCTVVVEQTGEAWELTVINALRERSGDTGVGVGLSAAKARAAAVGGRLDSRPVKESWVCEAWLPHSQDGA